MFWGFTHKIYSHIILKLSVLLANYDRLWLISFRQHTATILLTKIAPNLISKQLFFKIFLESMPPELILHIHISKILEGHPLGPWVEIITKNKNWNCTNVHWVFWQTETLTEKCFAKSLIKLLSLAQTPCKLWWLNYTDNLCQARKLPEANSVSIFYACLSNEKMERAWRCQKS